MVAGPVCTDGRNQENDSSQKIFPPRRVTVILDRSLNSIGAPCVTTAAQQQQLPCLCSFVECLRLERSSLIPGGREDTGVCVRGSNDISKV